MSSLPQQPYRIGALPAWTSLTEEAAVSTRGQRLPGPISTRSRSALFTLARHTRGRPGSFSMDGDEEASLASDDRPRRSNLVEIDSRRMSVGAEILMTPQVRSQRLIGNSNARYRWQQYYKPADELRKMKKPLRQYYERNNYLIARYLYIDRLLDSSLPHILMAEYDQPTQTANIPTTIYEERHGLDGEVSRDVRVDHKVKRTPKTLYKLPDEQSPLLEGEEALPDIDLEQEGDVESNSPVVTVAIYLNLGANILLLVGKIIVIALTASLSVLASLVDAILDFLSTAIVWTTTKLISRQDQYAYPVGRRRLEPVGVLVFSVIMITSFCQVALECFNQLISDDRSIVHLGVPAIAIMVSTVAIKGFCWFWCRLVKNSSVQALAQDAITDCVFNTFSIIFPLIGFYGQIWWLDALGGLLLSLYVIFNWSATTSQHVRNLCGAAATADERNVLLYLTMRFAKTIKSIQGLQAYHAGDKLNVEVDIVLDESTSLRDSHDLGESLQYVLESVPTVDRAFVHTDYKSINLPSHMNQQE
jgi:cation diffusion facilitator family transporter